MIQPRQYRAYTRKDIDRLPQLARLSAAERAGMKAVAAVLPFRVNGYVVEELIDWKDIPGDPMYQLTFPQPEMLGPEDFDHMVRLVERSAPPAELHAAARGIQFRLNPHPSGQMTLNTPHLDGVPLHGLQHKYRETVLFFPAAGQTCHAYCTYCFRWAQFIGIEQLRFADRTADSLVRYVKAHPEVTSVLITGGDPMIMKSSVLRRYVEPLLDPALEHVTSIRIGTKAPAYWPYRFVTDPDADDLLRLFGEIRASGRHVALMAHYSHPRELETPVAEAALRRIHAAGATVRTQAPLVRHVNDAPGVWKGLWKRQVRLGAVPYYMFVERDTGPKEYFQVPLARAVEIYTGAVRTLSGLGRTARGPVMSATPGKVVVDGVATVHGETVFVLEFLQARNPDWVGKPFFARYDRAAAWFDDLEPAFGRNQFFFERELAALKARRVLRPRRTASAL